ncbi:MAG: flippase-like domain-containing protein [Oscillospiraceae bacterium]|nr:flippase-like domain-containing protein [Oscillospiraceae bacterium]
MEKNKKKKSNKLNLIICGIAFLVMVFYLIFVDGVDNIIKAISNINPIFILICAIFMIGYWLCEAGTVHIMLRSMHPKMKFWNTWLVTIIGQYFNCITPSASGGQPMQAYYLVKFGIPLGSALTALLSRFIVYQFALTIYSIFTLIVGFAEFGDDLTQKGLMPFVLIGFVINTAVIVFLLGIAVWRSGTLKAANWIISVGVKLHIVKHPTKWRLYITREVDKFHENFKFLKKNVGIIIRSFVLNFIQLTLYLSISYMLYLGFGMREVSLLQVISYQAFVLMISSFIPLPGAMGAAELGYAGFFGDIFGDYTSVSTLLWRIFTFYLPIILGLIFTMTMKNQGIEEPSDMEVKENMYNMERALEAPHNEE